MITVRQMREVNPDNVNERLNDISLTFNERQLGLVEVCHGDGLLEVRLRNLTDDEVFRLGECLESIGLVYEG